MIPCLTLTLTTMNELLAKDNLSRVVTTCVLAVNLSNYDCTDFSMVLPPMLVSHTCRDDRDMTMSHTSLLLFYINLSHEKYS